MDPKDEAKTKFYKVATVFVMVLTVFAVVKIFTGFNPRGGQNGQQVNVISVTGHGELQAVPDIASIYFTIRQDGKTVKEAQDAVVVIEKKALDFLKGNGVADKDIKTSNASFNPKYQNQPVICPQIGIIGGGTYPCGGGNQIIIGYEAYESITVKIRVPDSVGKIMQGLGTVGVTELSGPNFTIDNEDVLKTQARTLAINDAKAKAKELANELGVSLGSVTSFNESGNYPIPMYAMDSSAKGISAPAPAPAQIPQGQNTISSDVTITYEIK